MGAIAGEAGEAAADAFLDVLWDTNPDHAEVLAAIKATEDLLDSLSRTQRPVATSPRSVSDEVETGAKLLRARLHEFKNGLTWRRDNLNSPEDVR